MPNVPLNALRTFEAAARHLSFSKGAEELHVSTAAVSSQIRTLEERLNQKLFHRRGRQISLTAAGRQLLPGVERGMRELRQAVQRLDADRNEGVLQVSMLPGFLQKWLMPRLGHFQEQHPDIDLRISADEAIIDFDRTDVQLAIRFGPGNYGDLAAEPLMEDWILPVCSPRFLAEHGPLDSAAALREHDLLYVDSPVWDSWFRVMGDYGRQRRVKLLNNAMAILMAAELGEGIALTRWSLVARDIAHGRLVRAVPSIVRTDWSYWLVGPTQHMELPKARAFLHWLEAECAEFERPEPDRAKSVRA